jgi:putative hsdS
MMLLKDVSVMKIRTGLIQIKINQENMNKIVVPEIPLKLLFEINQKLEVIDKQQLNLIEENKQLTQLRDWLLPMLMHGQVKVEF